MICGRIPSPTPVGDFWGEVKNVGTKVGAGAARGLAEYLDPASKPQVPTPAPAPVYYAPPPPSPPPPAPKKDNTMLLLLAAVFLLGNNK